MYKISLKYNVGRFVSDQREIHKVCVGMLAPAVYKVWNGVLYTKGRSI